MELRSAPLQGKLPASYGDQRKRHPFQLSSKLLSTTPVGEEIERRGRSEAGIEVGEFGETCNLEDKSTGESLSDEGDDLESEDTGIEQEEERQHEAEENAEREAKEMQRVERRRMRRVELS